MPDNNYYSNVDGKNNVYFPERSTKCQKIWQPGGDHSQIVIYTKNLALFVATFISQKL